MEKLSAIKGFPASYVLDLGDFIDADGCTYTDIVELNPLSSSLCYVNSSPFTVEVPEIAQVRQTWGMGFQFCLDYLSAPDRYVFTKPANRSYCLSRL